MRKASVCHCLTLAPPTPQGKMPHQATKERLTDHGFQGLGGLQHFTPNPSEPSNPIPGKSHLIGSRLWHLFLCLGLSEPCLPSTSTLPITPCQTLPGRWESSEAWPSPSWVPLAAGRQWHAG